jgi:hypothetical protein
LVQVGLVWLAVSLVAMAGLSAFVYLNGSRRRQGHEPRQLTFDDAEVYTISGDRRSDAGAVGGEGGANGDGSGSSGTGANGVPPRQEPAITRPVSAQSGVLPRLLAGVQLPCELERLHPDGEDEHLRMAFVTTGHDARVVAVSVVDELERLGMDVEPLSYSEARAWRDGFELAVTIFLEPRRVIRERRPAFPNAPADSVVIEFSVV